MLNPKQIWRVIKNFWITIKNETNRWPLLEQFFQAKYSLAAAEDARWKLYKKVQKMNEEQRNVLRENGLDLSQYPWTTGWCDDKTYLDLVCQDLKMARDKILSLETEKRIRLTNDRSEMRKLADDEIRRIRLNKQNVRRHLQQENDFYKKSLAGVRHHNDILDGVNDKLMKKNGELYKELEILKSQLDIENLRKQAEKEK